MSVTRRRTVLTLMALAFSVGPVSAQDDWTEASTFGHGGIGLGVATAACWSCDSDTVLASCSAGPSSACSQAIASVPPQSGLPSKARGPMHFSCSVRGFARSLASPRWGSAQLGSMQMPPTEAGMSANSGRRAHRRRSESWSNTTGTRTPAFRCREIARDLGGPRSRRWRGPSTQVPDPVVGDELSEYRVGEAEGLARS